MKNLNFYRLKVLGLYKKEKTYESGKKINISTYRCRCTCGKTKHFDAISLLSGHAKSCGCSRRIPEETKKSIVNVAKNSEYTNKEIAHLFELKESTIKRILRQ